MSALRSDLKVTEIANPAALAPGAVPGLVQPQHVDDLLDVFGYAEQFVLPGMIVKKSQGRIARIDPDIAERAFSFTQEQKDKLSRSGADTCNELLPEVVQRYIVKTSNVGAFFGGLMTTVKAQMEMAILLQLQRNANSPQPAAPATIEKPNGAARTVDLGSQPATTEAVGVQG